MPQPPITPIFRTTITMRRFLAAHTILQHTRYRLIPQSTQVARLTTSALCHGARLESGDKFGPGHHQPHPQKRNATALHPLEQKRVLERTRTKIDRVVDWARVVVYDGIERAHGRLTPALLDGVKLNTPKGGVPLKSVASITTIPLDRALRVEAFDPSTAKAVWASIKDAGIPGLSAEREDKVIFVQVAPPTGEVREGLIKNIHEGIESAKNQIRGARMDALRALGGRQEEGADIVQEVYEGAVGVLDGMWVGAREEMKKA